MSVLLRRKGVYRKGVGAGKVTIKGEKEKMKGLEKESQFIKKGANGE